MPKTTKTATRKPKPSNCRTFECSCIEWDTDGASAKKLGLSSTMIVEVTDADKDFNPAEELADYLSDKTGFCVFSFQWKETTK